MRASSVRRGFILKDFRDLPGSCQQGECEALGLEGPRLAGRCPVSACCSMVSWVTVDWDDTKAPHLDSKDPSNSQSLCNSEQSRHLNHNPNPSKTNQNKSKQVLGHVWIYIGVEQECDRSCGLEEDIQERSVTCQARNQTRLGRSAAPSKPAEIGDWTW